MNLRLAATLLISLSLHAQDDFPLTEESKPQPNVPKGQMLKDTYTARDGSVFPGTEREYQIYLPASLDTTKPAPFMVFQDGVIYQAPTVFDNLIAKKELPPMIGIFIKPGVVPAANENALPRYNRSYEYDSITDTYASFLIDEFLPAIVAKHQLNLSADPNARGISGNSSGGICAFMVAWHRPDQFRRVFTGVGTYVGIHGADQLPVLVRKYEPKPLRVFLQSGENDNNLYCGDWWMANQTMERSLTWNGYDVNHAWGKGGHNAKHASQIFPEVLRWLWKGYPDEPVKANPRGEAKWRGYEVVGAGEWSPLTIPLISNSKSKVSKRIWNVAASKMGEVFFTEDLDPSVWRYTNAGSVELYSRIQGASEVRDLTISGSDNQPLLIWKALVGGVNLGTLIPDRSVSEDTANEALCILVGANDRRFTGRSAGGRGSLIVMSRNDNSASDIRFISTTKEIRGMCLSPDESQLYFSLSDVPFIYVAEIAQKKLRDMDDPFAPPDGLPNAPTIAIQDAQRFGELEQCKGVELFPKGLCVDSNGWLYVATSLGIQVLDQAGRVNFIIPTPKQPHDVCFGGKDLSELFIACGDTIYKRPTKAKGYISGQMAPIKPPAPKL